MIDGDTYLEPEILRCIIHQNGQISYRAPDCSFIPKGNEIIVRCLPRETNIAEVIRLTEPLGKLLEVRLLIDFSGKCRGFSYVAFRTRVMARSAIENLNGSTFKGHKLSVEISVDNRRLHLNNIPKNYSESEMERVIRENCSGVEYIIPYLNYHNPNFNRGFLFVEFKSHALAAQARRLLIANGIPEWGSSEINVDWADPESDGLPARGSNKVFIRNIFGVDGPLSKDELQQFLDEHFYSHLIARVGPIVQDHVVVEFTSPSDADIAVCMLNKGVFLNGHRVFAELGREYENEVPPRAGPSSSSRSAGAEARPRGCRRSRSTANLPRRRDSSSSPLDDRCPEYLVGHSSLASDHGKSFSNNKPINGNEKKNGIRVLQLMYDDLKQHWPPFVALCMAVSQMRDVQLQCVVDKEGANYRVKFFEWSGSSRRLSGALFPRDFIVHAENPNIALRVAVENAVASVP